MRKKIAKAAQAVAGLLTAVSLTVAVCGCSDARSEDEFDSVTTPPFSLDSSEDKHDGGELDFPYMIEEAQLRIESLSAATIPNPDAGGEMGDDIACLEITNMTGQYILQADLMLTLSDTQTYHFEIHDLPVNDTVQAFDVNNAVLDFKSAAKRIEVTDLQFAEGDQLMKSQISIEVQELTVTLTNISQADLGPLEVICLCDFDGTYFGGRSYSYTVDGIRAGQSVSFDAVDCYLGKATVVRIASSD